MLPETHELANCKFLDEQTIKNWIRNGPDIDSIEEVKKFSKYIAQDLKKVKISKSKTVNEEVSTSQIRQIFSKLKTIEAKEGLKRPENIVEFIMLNPLMAYTVGRHKKTGLNALKDRLNIAIKEVVMTNNKEDKQKKFKNFCRLFEAILAYHKAYGGN